MDPAGRPTTGAPAPARGREPAELRHIQPSLPGSLASAWRSRRLLTPLGSRFLGKFVHGTKLGRSWLLIRPLMDSLGNALLFGGLLRIASPNGIPYFVFLMSGLIGWRLFERGVMYSTRSFSVYRKLMKRHHFPLFLVPLAGMAYPVLEIAVYCLVLAGALAFYVVTDGTLYLQSPPQVLLVLPAALLLLALAVGVSLWTSVLNARAQDVRYVLRYVLPIWLYLTPVVYPTSKIPESWAWLTVVNPMAAPVELMKMGLLGVGRITPASLGVSVGFAVVVLVSGAWFFNRQAAWTIEREDGDHEFTDV